jgi:type II secretion system protein G
VEGFQEERRGLFDGLRVPQSVTAVLVAAIGLLVYVAGIWAIEALAEVPPQGGPMCRLLGGMLGNLTSQIGFVGQLLADVGGFRNVWTPYKPIVWISFGIWSTGVWAAFAGGIQRIAAMQLAREESVDLREALRFGWRKFGQNFLSVVLVWAILGTFWLVVNSTLAGGIGRIPYVGDLLLGVFFVVVLITSFVIVFVATLGVLGFNLASAAIATEDSDTFDGVSRSWNYILARPWTLLLTYAATFIYLGIVVSVGGYLTQVSIKSLSTGWWGLGWEARSPVTLDAETKARLQLPADSQLDVVYLPGKADYLYNRVVGHEYHPDDKGRVVFRQGVELALERFRRDVGRYPSTDEGLRALLDHPRGYREVADPATNRQLNGWAGPYLEDLLEVPRDRFGNPYAYQFPGKRGAHYDLFSMGPDGAPHSADDRHGVQGIALGHGPRLDIGQVQETILTGFTARAVSLWVNLARLLLSAYVVAYFLCAQTTVYFLLRHDVEGDDYSEITLEGDPEDELEQPFEYASFQQPTSPSTADEPAKGEAEQDAKDKTESGDGEAES